MEADLLTQPPPKIEVIYGGGLLNSTASINIGQPTSDW